MSSVIGQGFSDSLVTAVTGITDVIVSSTSPI
jgi:hypothetical protein